MYNPDRLHTGLGSIGCDWADMVWLCHLGRTRSYVDCMDWVWSSFLGGYSAWAINQDFHCTCRPLPGHFHVCFYVTPYAHSRNSVPWNHWNSVIVCHCHSPHINLAFQSHFPIWQHLFIANTCIKVTHYHHLVSSGCLVYYPLQYCVQHVFDVILPVIRWSIDLHQC